MLMMMEIQRAVFWLTSSNTVQYLLRVSQSLSLSVGMRRMPRGQNEYRQRKPPRCRCRCFILSISASNSNNNKKRSTITPPPPTIFLHIKFTKYYKVANDTYEAKKSGRSVNENVMYNVIATLARPLKK